MKTAILCASISGVAFLLMGWQTGMFEASFGTGAPAEPTPPTITPLSTAKFPEDLAPAARAQPVPDAADLPAERKTFKTVVLRSSGVLDKWQEYLPEEWRSYRVQDTQLVLVVGPQKKTFLSKQHYPNGAPSVSRYKFEMEASVVAAKTGKVLSWRRFENIPRPVKNLEAWELTEISRPVSWRTVFDWLQHQAAAGFPEERDPPAIVTIIE